jgi:hypothetical protein
LITIKQRAANALNAKSSTGPKTVAGKSTSSQNAITHGLLAKCALMPGDDEAEYAALHAMLYQDFAPSGGYWELLVDDLADLYWRLGRILHMEGEIVVYARLAVQRAAITAKVTNAESKAKKIDKILNCSTSPEVKILQEKEAAAQAEVTKARSGVGGAFLYTVENGDPLAKLARHETRIRNEIRKIVAELNDRPGKPSTPKMVSPDDCPKALNGSPADGSLQKGQTG